MCYISGGKIACKGVRSKQRSSGGYLLKRKSLFT